MYILGIAAYQYNSAAALIRDGEVLICLEEDRFIRQKNTGAFPVHAIKECLAFAAIEFTDIEAVVFNHTPWKGFSWDIVLNSICKREIARAQLNRALYFLSFRSKILDDFKKHFAYEYKCIKKKIKCVEHHIAHMGSTYYVSPFAHSALLSIDGGGESTTAVLGYGEKNKISVLKRIRYPISFGKFYAAVTEYLGFEPNKAEGTVMALSAYGNGEYQKIFSRMLSVDKNVSMDLSFFDYFRTASRRYSEHFRAVFGPQRNETEDVSQKHMNIAHAAQQTLESSILRLVAEVRRRTSCENICLSGGVFLNCQLNQRIREANIFKNVFIQPAPHDAGTSFGAALIWYYRSHPKLQKRHVFTDPFKGNEFTQATIEKVLQDTGIKQYHVVSNVAEHAAQMLAAGKVIGWFQGRSEVGPRALGNRSILVDPRNRMMRDYVNFNIKKREWFRPLAPAVLAEYKDEYFEAEDDSPYMLFTVKCKNEKQKNIAACIHVDSTARIQTVHRDTNMLFYELIRTFYQLTGVPIILNTSLNLKGDPIVNTPHDAVKVFQNTPLDALYIGNVVIY